MASISFVIQIQLEMYEKLIRISFLCCVMCIPGGSQSQTKILRKTEGSSVDFNCSTSQQDSVEWRYTSPSSVIPRVIYGAGLGLLIKSGKYKMNRETDGRYDLALVNANKSDSGVYACFGDDGVGNVIASYNLTVFKPLLITTNGFNEGEVGDTFSVVCVTDMDESIAIHHWPIGQTSSNLLYAGYSVVNSTNRNVEVERKGSREYQLTIRNATEEMSGMYECVDHNGRGLVNITIRRLSASTSTTPLFLVGDQSTTEGTSNKSAGTNTALIIGIVAGIVIALAVIVYMIRRRWCRKGSQDEAATPLNEIQQNSDDRVIFSKDIGSVCAVTILNDKIYCLIKQSIVVYEATNFQLERCILLEKVGNELCGLTSSNVHKCLYISDSENESIHTVNLHEDCAVTSWSTLGKPLGLSVNYENNLLVVCHELNRCENGLIRSKLIEYKAGNELVREVLLQADLEGAVHAIQLNEEFFLVTHNNDKKRRVCVVDTSGSVIKSYGEKGDGYEKPLGHVQHIAYDIESKLIFVADEDGGRIQVILLSDLKLVFEREVMVEGNEDKPPRPRALCFDERCDRLYIGDMVGIKVVQVRKPKRA